MAIKVLQVIDKLDVGGAERVSVDLSILLSKQESVSVNFLCLLDTSVLDKELLDEGIPVIYLKRPNRYSLSSLQRLYNLLNEYDIVHVHSRHVLRYIGLCLLVPKKFKLVFHDHFGCIETTQNISSYTCFCMKQCNAYIGVSQSLVKWARQNHVNRNINILGNIKRKLTQPEVISKTSTMVSVGNFRPQKNYEYLVNLISELPSWISIDIYGNIVDQDYYDKISGLIKEKKLNDRIRIIPNVSQVGPLLANYKLAIHCASSETGPLVAIEYLEKQLPFVMYHTGEVATQIAMVTEDILLKTFDPIVWKNKIERLLNDSDYRYSIIEKLKMVYKAHYSEKKYIEQCLKIYQEL